ncbi:Hpt domain-containing protein [Edaphobacter acidisoli]|nr:Hpt domain-containing protein [Edaphobacter acidisoli]
MDQKTEAKVDHLIAELWRKNLPSLRDRLDMLDRAAAEAASGKLTEATRAEAQSIAHKLAGNLGMFGYPKGSEVASKMEHALKTPTSETLLTLTELAKQLRQTLPGL